MFAFDNWKPLTVHTVHHLLRDAPLDWCLAGGYAVAQFLGRHLRSHADIDVVVFRVQQLSAQRWLKDWAWYAADPPGALRPWRENEYLPVGIHDIWGYRQNADAWQLQIMLQEVSGDSWFYRYHPNVRRPREAFIRCYRGVPCIGVEIQLMYKARHPRPKDELDFQACLPVMAPEAKAWLRRSLEILFPTGHPWLDVFDKG